MRRKTNFLISNFGILKISRWRQMVAGVKRMNSREQVLVETTTLQVLAGPRSDLIGTELTASTLHRRPLLIHNSIILRGSLNASLEIPTICVVEWAHLIVCLYSRQPVKLGEAGVFDRTRALNIVFHINGICWSRINVNAVQWRLILIGSKLLLAAESGNLLAIRLERHFVLSRRQLTILTRGGVGRHQLLSNNSIAR